MDISDDLITNRSCFLIDIMDACGVTYISDNFLLSVQETKGSFLYFSCPYMELRVLIVPKLSTNHHLLPILFI